MNAANGSGSKAKTLYVGSFPAAGIRAPVGTWEGIWRVSYDPGGESLGPAELVASFPAPSSLAAHPRASIVYAVSEQAVGAVGRFLVDEDGGLRLDQVIATDGSYPCHLAVAPDGRSLLVANYGDGTVSRIALDDAGGMVSFSSWRSDRPGSAVHATRQDGSHPHYVWFDRRTGRWLVTDLGTDRLLEIEAFEDGILLRSELELPPGSGPRHIAQLPDGRIVVNGELDNAVHIVTRDRNGYLLEASVPLLPPEELAPGSLSSHIAVVGARIFAAVRGPDVLLAIDAQGAGLVRTPSWPSGGRFPRHFVAIQQERDRYALIVANTYSDEIELHRADALQRMRASQSVRIPAATGLLVWDDDQAPVPEPGHPYLPQPVARAVAALQVGDLEGWLACFADDGCVIDMGIEERGASLRRWSIEHATGVDARVTITWVAMIAPGRSVLRYDWWSRRYIGPSIVSIDYDDAFIRRFHVLGAQDADAFLRSRPDLAP